jgi:hypothetical protein
MKTMIEAVDAMDEYIHRQLGFSCKQGDLELFTDGVASIYIKHNQTMKKPLWWMTDALLHDLIDARNYIVFGKAKRVNQGNVNEIS